MTTTLPEDSLQVPHDGIRDVGRNHVAGSKETERSLPGAIPAFAKLSAPVWGAPRAGRYALHLVGPAIPLGSVWIHGGSGRTQGCRVSMELRVGVMNRAVAGAPRRAGTTRILDDAAALPAGTLLIPVLCVRPATRRIPRESVLRKLRAARLRTESLVDATLDDVWALPSPHAPANRIPAPLGLGFDGTLSTWDTAEKLVSRGATRKLMVTASSLLLTSAGHADALGDVPSTAPWGMRSAAAAREDLLRHWRDLVGPAPASVPGAPAPEVDLYMWLSEAHKMGGARSAKERSWDEVIDALSDEPRAPHAPTLAQRARTWRKAELTRKSARPQLVPLVDLGHVVVGDEAQMSGRAVAEKHLVRFLRDLPPDVARPPEGAPWATWEPPPMVVVAGPRDTVHVSTSRSLAPEADETQHARWLADGRGVVTVIGVDPGAARAVARRIWWRSQIVLPKRTGHPPRSRASSSAAIALSSFASRRRCSSDMPCSLNRW